MWPLPNIWMGVTVESDRYLSRIDDLREVPAAIRFVSFEPLLGPMPADLDLRGISWVIVGGESGPGARPINYQWVLGIRDACERQGVPFFFKQWGGRNKKKTGRQLQGRTWDGMPEELQ
jgi:protein gp37